MNIEIVETVLIKVYILKDYEISQGVQKSSTAALPVVMRVLDSREKEKSSPDNHTAWLLGALDTRQPKPREKMEHHGTCMGPWDIHEP